MWMWNGVSGDVVSVFGGHEGAITCGGFSLDGKWAMSGSQDMTFRIWKPTTGEQVHKISGHLYHREGVICFDQHDQQPIIVSGSLDKCVCFVNFESGKVIGKSGEFEGGIGEVCFIRT